MPPPDRHRARAVAATVVVILSFAGSASPQAPPTPYDTPSPGTYTSSQYGSPSPSPDPARYGSPSPSPDPAQYGSPSPGTYISPSDAFALKTFGYGPLYIWEGDFNPISAGGVPDDVTSAASGSYILAFQSNVWDGEAHYLVSVSVSDSKQAELRIRGFTAGAMKFYIGRTDHELCTSAPGSFCTDDETWEDIYVISRATGVDDGPQPFQVIINMTATASVSATDTRVPRSYVQDFVSLDIDCSPLPVDRILDSRLCGGLREGQTCTQGCRSGYTGPGESRKCDRVPDPEFAHDPVQFMHLDETKGGDCTWGWDTYLDVDITIALEMPKGESYVEVTEGLVKVVAAALTNFGITEWDASYAGTVAGLRETSAIGGFRLVSDDNETMVLNLPVGVDEQKVELAQGELFSKLAPGMQLPGGTVLSRKVVAVVPPPVVESCANGYLDLSQKPIAFNSSHGSQCAVLRCRGRHRFIWSAFDMGSCTAGPAGCSCAAVVLHTHTGSTTLCGQVPYPDLYDAHTVLPPDSSIVFEFRADTANTAVGSAAPVRVSVRHYCVDDVQQPPSCQRITAPERPMLDAAGRALIQYPSETQCAMAAGAVEQCWVIECAGALAITYTVAELASCLGQLEIRSLRTDTLVSRRQCGSLTGDVVVTGDGDVLVSYKAPSTLVGDVFDLNWICLPFTDPTSRAASRAMTQLPAGGYYTHSGRWDPVTERGAQGMNFLIVCPSGLADIAVDFYLPNYEDTMCVNRWVVGSLGTFRTPSSHPTMSPLDMIADAQDIYVCSSESINGIREIDYVRIEAATLADITTDPAAYVEVKYVCINVVPNMPAAIVSSATVKPTMSSYATRHVPAVDQCFMAAQMRGRRGRGVPGVVGDGTTAEGLSGCTVVDTAEKGAQVLYALGQNATPGCRGDCVVWSRNVLRDAMADSFSIPLVPGTCEEYGGRTMTVEDCGCAAARLGLELATDVPDGLPLGEGCYYATEGDTLVMMMHIPPGGGVCPADGVTTPNTHVEETYRTIVLNEQVRSAAVFATSAGGESGDIVVEAFEEMYDKPMRVRVVGECEVGLGDEAELCQMTSSVTIEGDRGDGSKEAWNVCDGSEKAFKGSFTLIVQVHPGLGGDEDDSRPRPPPMGEILRVGYVCRALNVQGSAWQKDVSPWPDRDGRTGCTCGLRDVSHWTTRDVHPWRSHIGRCVLLRKKAVPQHTFETMEMCAKLCASDPRCTHFEQLGAPPSPCYHFDCTLQHPEPPALPCSASTPDLDIPELSEFCAWDSSCDSVPPGSWVRKSDLCAACGACHPTHSSRELVRAPFAFVRDGACDASVHRTVTTDDACRAAAMHFGLDALAAMPPAAYPARPPAGCFLLGGAWYVGPDTGSAECCVGCVCACAPHRPGQSTAWRVSNLSPVSRQWVVSALQFFADDACHVPLVPHAPHTGSGTTDEAPPPCDDAGWPLAHVPDTWAGPPVEAGAVCAALHGAGLCQSTLAALGVRAADFDSPRWEVSRFCPCCSAHIRGGLVYSSAERCQPPHDVSAGSLHNGSFARGVGGHACDGRRHGWTPGPRPSRPLEDFVGFRFPRDVGVRCVRIGQSPDAAEHADRLLLERRGARDRWEAVAVLDGAGFSWQRAVAAGEHNGLPGSTFERRACDGTVRRAVTRDECVGVAQVRGLPFFGAPREAVVDSAAGFPPGCVRFQPPAEGGEDDGLYWNDGPAAGQCGAETQCVCGDSMALVGMGTCVPGVPGVDDGAKLSGKDVPFEVEYSQATLRHHLCAKMVAELEGTTVYGVQMSTPANAEKFHVCHVIDHVDAAEAYTPQFAKFDDTVTEGEARQCWVPHGAGVGYPFIRPRAGEQVGCNAPVGDGTCVDFAVVRSVAAPGGNVLMCKCLVGYQCEYYSGPCKQDLSAGVCGMEPFPRGSLAPLRPPTAHTGAPAVVVIPPFADVDYDRPLGECNAPRAEGYDDDNLMPWGCVANTYVHVELYMHICACVGGMDACHVQTGECAVDAWELSGKCGGRAQVGESPCLDPDAVVNPVTGMCACMGGMPCNAVTGLCEGYCYDACDHPVRDGCLCTNGAVREGGLCRCSADMRCDRGGCVAADTMQYPAVVDCRHPRGGGCGVPATCGTHCYSSHAYVDADGTCRCIAGAQCDSDGYCVLSAPVGYCGQAAPVYGTCGPNSHVDAETDRCVCDDGYACGARGTGSDGTCRIAHGSGMCDDFVRADGRCVPHAREAGGFCRCAPGWGCARGFCVARAGTGWCNGELSAGGDPLPSGGIPWFVHEVTPRGTCSDPHATPIAFRGVQACFCPWGHDCDQASGVCLSRCQGPGVVIAPDPATGLCTCAEGWTCDGGGRCVLEDDAALQGFGTPCGAPCVNNECPCAAHASSVGEVCRCSAGYVCDQFYRRCEAGSGPIASCNVQVTAGGCRKHAFANSAGMCECEPGRSCDAGVCRVPVKDVCSVHEASQMHGVCDCFNDELNGFYVGSCDTCASTYFGSGCRMQCSTFGSCLDCLETGPDGEYCRCNNQFHGLTCDECSPDRGYTGAACDRKINLWTQTIEEHVLHPRPDRQAWGGWQVEPHSVFRVQYAIGAATMEDLGDVVLCLDVYTEEGDLATPNCGEIDESFMVDAYLGFSTEMLLVRCSDTPDLWANGQCTTSIPRAASVVVHILVFRPPHEGPGPGSKIDAEVTLSGISAACQGRGFWLPDDYDAQDLLLLSGRCVCPSHETLGFWKYNPSTGTCVCKSGYTGSDCLDSDFDNEAYREAASFPETVAAGVSEYYMLQVSEETGVTAALVDGVGDCDLTAQFMASCPEGWFRYGDDCYMVQPGCYTHDEAAATCRQDGGVLADIPAAEEFLEVLTAQIQRTPLRSPECPHRDKVWIDLQQTTPQQRCPPGSPWGTCAQENFCDEACQDVAQCSSYTDQAACEAVSVGVPGASGPVLVPACVWNTLHAPLTTVLGVPDCDWDSAAPLDGDGICEPSFRYTQQASTAEKLLEAHRLANLNNFMVKTSVQFTDCGEREERVDGSMGPPDCPLPECVNPRAPNPMDPNPCMSCDGTVTGDPYAGWAHSGRVHSPAYVPEGSCGAAVPRGDGAKFVCTGRLMGPEDCERMRPGPGPCEACEHTGLSLSSDRITDCIVNENHADKFERQTSSALRRCTVLMLDNDKNSQRQKLWGVPAFCSNIAGQYPDRIQEPQTPDDYGLIFQGSALCKKPAVTANSATADFFDGQQELVEAALDDSYFTEPAFYEPLRFPAADDSMSMLIPADHDLLALRVTCLTADPEQTYTLSARYIPAGHFNIDGTCVQSPSQGYWTGPFCSECRVGYTGSNCDKRLSCAAVCQNGRCEVQGGVETCVCYLDWYGASCDLECSEGSCPSGMVCNERYGTKNSEPQCVDRCNRATNDLRSSSDDPTVVLFAVGPHCGYDCTCGRGAAACTMDEMEEDLWTECICHEDPRQGYWAGETCDECADGYYGTSCTVACDGAVRCSGHGQCATQFGTVGCTCDDGYFGDDCSTPCNAITCVHGTCNSRGKCECYASYLQGFWGDEACKSCAFSYWGADCRRDCRCSSHGGCDAVTGVCKCVQDSLAGYWAGTACDECSGGWTGTSCNVPVSSQRNQLSVVHKMRGLEASRSDKSYETLDGALLRVDPSVCTSTTLVTMVAGVGRDISVWRRSCRGAVRDWTHHGTCNLRRRIGFGTDIVKAVASGNFALLALVDREASESALVVIEVAGFSAASDFADCSVDLAITSFFRPSPFFGEYSNDIVDMAVDPVRGWLYLLVTRSIYGESHAVAAPAHYIVQLSSDVNVLFGDAMDAMLEDGPRVHLTAFSSVSGLVVQNASTRGVVSSRLVVMGTTTNGSVAVALYSAATLDHEVWARGVVSDDIRDMPPQELNFLLLFWLPCGALQCSSIQRYTLADSLLVMAIRTSTSSGYGVAIAELNLLDIKGAGSFAIRDTGIAMSLDESGTHAGIGFLSYHSGRVYVATQAMTPSRIYQLDAQTSRPEAPALQLLYENTAQNRQLAVGSYVDADAAVMYILVKASRTTVVAVNLYNVFSVDPIVADLDGGTIVTVTGHGFADVAPACKFGDTLVKGVAFVTYQSDTTVLCKAPPARGDCLSLPVEVSFLESDRFSTNVVSLRRVPTPIISSLMPDRNALQSYEAITVAGSRFFDSQYLKCFIDGEVTTATYFSTTSIGCTQPVRTQPASTTVEITLDGQIFTSQEEPYFIVGLPRSMAAAFKACRVPPCGDFVPENDQDFFSLVSTQITQLTNITVGFFDSAGVFVGRSTALRNGQVTIALKNTPGGSPRGKQFDGLFGTLTQPVVDGQAVFSDLHLKYPLQGFFEFECSFTPGPKIDAALVAGIGNATTVVRIVAQATRLDFEVSPPRFSSNKEALTGAPTTVKYSDVSGNVIAGAGSGGLLVTIALAAQQELPTAEVGGTVHALVAGVPQPLPVLDGAAGIKPQEGAFRFGDLRVFDGVEGYFYTLTFADPAAPGIAQLVSDPFYIAECSDMSSKAVYEIRPSYGLLSAATVTVKGWGFREADAAFMSCKYGDDAPLPAVFVDTCTLLCSMPARTRARSSALEVQYTEDMYFQNAFTAEGLRYTYIDAVDDLEATVGRMAYPSDYEVELDAITAKFLDAAGSWVRDLDTEDRTLYLKTDLPLVQPAASLSAPGNASVHFAGVRVRLPPVGMYSVVITTDPADTVASADNFVFGTGGDIAVNLTLLQEDAADAVRELAAQRNKTEQTWATCAEPASVRSRTCVVNAPTCTVPPPQGGTCADTCNCESEIDCAGAGAKCEWSAGGTCMRAVPCFPDGYTCTYSLDAAASLRAPDCVEPALRFDTTGNCTVAWERKDLGARDEQDCLKAAVTECTECAWVSFNRWNSACAGYTGACWTEDTVVAAPSWTLARTVPECRRDSRSDVCTAGCSSRTMERPTVGGWHFRTSFGVLITHGAALKLKFFMQGAVSPITGLPEDHYSLFTTSRRKLDVTPAVHVVDVGGNTVTTFDGQPTVEVTIRPECDRSPGQSQDDFDHGAGCLTGSYVPDSVIESGEAVYGEQYGPLCIGVPATGTTQDLWLSTCPRAKGHISLVSKGFAYFSSLMFVGMPSVKYRMHFTLSSPAVPPLVSEQIRALDCPCLEPMCLTKPDWLFLAGGTLTIKGFDFQADRQLEVQVGSIPVAATYVDTCTAVAVLPALGAVPRRSAEALGNSSRGSHALSLGAGRMSLRLLDKSNVDFLSGDLAFQLKEPVPDRLGIATGCTIAYAESCPLRNARAADDSRECEEDPEDDSTIPMRCYTTAARVSVGPVHIVMKDIGNGDLVEGQGFDPITSEDVDIVVSVLAPGSETRQVTVQRSGERSMAICDKATEDCAGRAFNGTRTARTSFGAVTFDDFTISLPMTGTYTLNFTAVTPSSGRVLDAGMLRLQFAVGAPHTFGFATEPPTRVAVGQLPSPPVLAVKDIAGNPLSSRSLSGTVDVGVSIEAYELATLPDRPRRLVKDIDIDERWEAKLYREANRLDQIIATGVPSEAQSSRATLVVPGNTRCAATCYEGETTCTAGGAGGCWLPLFSFHPGDLGGALNYDKVRRYRTNPDGVYEFPYFNGGDAQLSVLEATVDTSALATFKGLRVADVWHGVVYRMTYRIMNSGYDFLPAVSHNLTQALCPTGQFGVNFSTGCLQCPDEGICDGSPFIQAKIGYWRARETDFQFYPCKAGNCDAGDRRLAGDDLCVEGMMGPACSVCDSRVEKWGRAGDTCIKCPPDWQSGLMVFAFVLGMFIVILFLVKTNLSGGGKQKSRLSIVVKILMNYLQTAALMKDFQEHVKQLMRDIQDTQDSVAGPSTNFGGFGCLTQFNQYQIFQMWMILPLAVFLIPGLIAMRLSLANVKRRRKTLSELEAARDRLHALGLQAPEEELAIAQIKAVLNSRPVPETLDVRKETSRRTDDPPPDANGNGPAGKYAVDSDDEYVTDANIAAGHTMQDGWGDHEEVVQQQQQDALQEAQASAAAAYLEGGQCTDPATPLDTAPQATPPPLRLQVSDLKERDDCSSLASTPVPVDHIPAQLNLLYEIPDVNLGTTLPAYSDVAAAYFPGVVLALQERATIADIAALGYTVAEIDECFDLQSVVQSASSRPASRELAYQPQLPVDHDSTESESDAVFTAQATPAVQELPAPVPVAEEGWAGGLQRVAFFEENTKPPQDAQFNVGEYCEVRGGVLKDWAPGIVIGMYLSPPDVDPGPTAWRSMYRWRALVLLDRDSRSLPPAEYIAYSRCYDEIRAPTATAVRTLRDAVAAEKVYNADSTARIVAMQLCGPAWKERFTWTRRWLAVQRVAGAMQKFSDDRTAMFAELRKEFLSTDETDERLELMTSMVEVEAADRRQYQFTFIRIAPRKRWAALQQLVAAAVKRQRLLRIRDAIKRGRVKQAKKVTADSIYFSFCHLVPGTFKLQPTDNFDSSQCTITAIQVNLSSVTFKLLLEGSGELPSLDGVEMFHNGAPMKIKSRTVRAVSHSKQVRQVECAVVAQVIDMLRVEDTIRMKYGDDWTDYVGVAYDRYCGLGRDEHSIFKCTVCQLDLAVYCCDLCGEEREPNMPWAERQPPFYQPCGTRAKLAARQLQIPKPDSDLQLPFSGELLCERCNSVVHGKDGNREYHLQARHSANVRIKHADVADRPVLRRLIVQEQKPKYDTTTPAGRIRYDHEHGKRGIEYYVVIVLVVIFLIYPNLMTQISTLVKCEDFPDLDDSFLAVDMQLSCSTSEYKQWLMLAQFFFVLYGVGIPIGGALLLYSYSGKDGRNLLRKSTNALLGFLYSGYRLDRYYWEMVIMLRKMLVVFILVFFEGTWRPYRLMCGLWIIIIFLFLNIFMKPFMYTSLWRLENVALGCVCISLNLSMLYDDAYGLTKGNKVAVTIIIVAVNLATLAMFLWVIVFDAGAEQLADIFDTQQTGRLTWDKITDKLRGVLGRKQAEEDANVVLTPKRGESSADYHKRLADEAEEVLRRREQLLGVTDSESEDVDPDVPIGDVEKPLKRRTTLFTKALVERINEYKKKAGPLPATDATQKDVAIDFCVRLKRQKNAKAAQVDVPADIGFDGGRELGKCLPSPQQAVSRGLRLKLLRKAGKAVDDIDVTSPESAHSVRRLSEAAVADLEDIDYSPRSRARRVRILNTT